MSNTNTTVVDNPLIVAGRQLQSRLIVGTGKYKDYPTMQEALQVSGTDVVTVAVRRERLVNEKGESLLDFIDTDNALRSSRFNLSVRLKGRRVAITRIQAAASERSQSSQSIRFHRRF